MKKAFGLFAGAAAACGLTISGVGAQDTDQPQQNPPVQESAQDLQTDEAQPNNAAGTLQPGQSGEQAEKQAQQKSLHQVDDLVGAKIRNPQGEDLGEVEEMVVDVNDGSIRYAVVSYGGFLDVGDELFAVPLKAMKLQQNEDGEAFFVLDIDKQRLENAKGFDNDNWPNFADASFTSSVDRTYGIEPSQQSSARQGALYKLSTFEGVNVRDQGNAEIGEVEAILVDAKDAKVALLALSLEDEAQAENQDDDALVLVPMKQFSLKTQDDDTFLQVQAPLDKIRNAPKVTEDQLEDGKAHMELRQKAESHFGGAAQNNRPQTEQPQAEPQIESPATEQPATDSENPN